MASWKKIISEDSSGVASISTKLGVGTASPTENLHIVGELAVEETGSSSGILKFRDTDQAILGQIGLARTTNAIATGSANLDLVSRLEYNGKFMWNQQNTNRMTLTSTGLGIGTTSPSYKLDIQSNNSAGTIVQIRDTGDDYPCGVTYNHAVSGHHIAWYAGTMDGTSGERKFTIGSKISNGFHNDLTTSSYSLLELNQADSSSTFNGPVDIRKSGSNTRHADTALYIGNTNAASHTAQLQLMSGNAGYSNIYLGDTNSYSQGGFVYEHSSDKLYFRTSNATKMTLDSNGRLGVGTMSPSYNLDITTGMRINRSGNVPFILLHKDGTGLAQIRGVSGGGINFTDASSATSRLYINNSGDIGINHTSPAAMLDVAGSLKIQGNATFDQQVTHEDMVTFNSDVSFTNASIEGLSVSTSKILVLQSSACSSGQDVNDSSRDIYWQSMSTENNTYVSWSAGSDGYFISFAQAGEYMVYVDLIVTDATANDRMNFFGWISHMSAGESTYYSYPLSGAYIRDDSSLYDSGGIGGNARLIVAANDKVKVNTQRFDSQDSLDDNPLNTSLSRIRIEKINYNLSTG